jgi:phosphate transport system substrate-binding protein
MPRTRSLDFRHFAERARWASRAGAALAIAAALIVLGCTRRKPSPTPEESLTSGSIRIVAAHEAWAVIDRAAADFERLYPESRIGRTRGTSRDAVAALFGARADVAVITRELLPEERRAAVEGRLELEGYRYAKDALVMVVHPSNPVENVAMEDLRRIYSGQATDWSQAGGRSGAIVPVAQPVRTDVTEFFVQDVLGGEPMRAAVQTEAADSTVVRRVAREAGAIGYVTLGARTQGVKVLRVAPLTGLTYWKPDPETVYKGDYPLTRFQAMYVRADGPPMAKGLITFVTSIDGQKIVRETGLVPATVPVRFVRRSPMLSTHAPGDTIRNP